MQLIVIAYTPTYPSTVSMSIKPGPAICTGAVSITSCDFSGTIKLKMHPITDGSGVGFPHPNPTLSFWLQGTRNNSLIGHRTTETIPTDADVVVIGGGMSGAAIAYYLFKGHDPVLRGALPKVVMLEAREACYGATGRNGGHCKPDFYRGAWCEFVTWGLSEWILLERLSKVQENIRQGPSHEDPSERKSVIFYCS